MIEYRTKEIKVRKGEQCNPKKVWGVFCYYLYDGKGKNRQHLKGKPIEITTRRFKTEQSALDSKRNQEESEVGCRKKYPSYKNHYFEVVKIKYI